MEKKTYEALPGVEWVNGQPVPADRALTLTASEAQFDLDQGRIVLKDQPMPEPVTEEPTAPRGKR